MYQLSRGQLTHDRRLDRVIHFDPKSKSYPITAVLPTKTPRSYTWQLPIVLDQGNEGACVGFSLTHELAAIPRKEKDTTSDTALRIYREAQKIDEWEGEQYSGTSVLAGAKVVTQLGYYKEYRWAFGLNEVLLAISRSGPCVLGLNWYSGMFRADDKGFIHATGEWQGGHAIIARGVNLKQRYVLLTNSWGTDWSENGNCKLSFDDLDKLLREQGECLVPVRRKHG